MKRLSQTSLKISERAKIGQKWHGVVPKIACFGTQKGFRAKKYPFSCHFSKNRAKNAVFPCH